MMNCARYIRRVGSLAVFLGVAVGIAAMFISPVPAQAEPGCAQYQFDGSFGGKHGSYAIWFDATGTTVSGLEAHYRQTDLSRDNAWGTTSESSGTANGGIQGRNFDVTIDWKNGAAGRYTGTVDDNGYVHGKTVEVSDPGLFHFPNGIVVGQPSADWNSTTRLVCAPPPPPAEVGPPKRIGYSSAPDVQLENVFGGVKVTVQNTRDVASECVYSATPVPGQNPLNQPPSPPRQFHLPASEKVDFQINGIFSATMWEVTVDCDHLRTQVVYHQF